MFHTKKPAVFLQHAALGALASVTLLSSPLASANTAPKISGKPVTSIMVMHAYAFQPTASDANHDKLTFSISNKPWWAAFSSATGKLSGTPQNTGTFSAVGICVSDGASRICLPTFVLKVAAPTAPPVITGKPAITAKVGSPYSFQPAGHDPSGLKVTFGIFDKPSWLTFNRATGKLSGTPTAANVGGYAHIGITISNGYRTAQLPSFSITVPSQGTALPPSAVTIAWTPPTENTNGSTLTDLAGYHIYYGTSQSNLSKVVDITNPGVASYVLSTMSAGTWYFALTSINSQGVESARSAVVSTVVD